MQRLVRFFSFNSFPLLSNALGLVLAIALLSNGLDTLDVVLVGAYVIGAGLFARRFRAPASQLAAFDSLAAFDRALRDPRPTMLEFYSANCAVCMAVQPEVERLEREAAQRLQILRLDVNNRLGRQLADRYHISVTPTFVLLNGAGLQDEAFTFFLDRRRVLYWLDQQTISAPLPGITRS